MNIHVDHGFIIWLPYLEGLLGKLVDYLLFMKSGSAFTFRKGKYCLFATSFQRDTESVSITTHFPASEVHFSASQF